MLRHLSQNLSMKRIYLILAVIGFILPNYLVLQESLDTGNILLYAHPMDTLSAMFANRIASIFAIDLFVAVMVFFVWTWHDQGKKAPQKLLLIWALTMLFGFACGLPLYLYLRQTSPADTIKASEDLSAQHSSALQ